MIPIKDNIRGRYFPFVNIALILLNAAVFYMELRQPDKASLEKFVYGGALIPSTFLSNPLAEWPRLFTSMFFHAGWMHFLGNMLYLWIFGDNVEDRLGHRRYLFFYFLTGAAASGAQTVLSPASTIPLIGASGAIAGVLGAYFVLYPRAKILALVPIWIFVRFLEIPAVLFLGFWFLLQALQSWGSLLQSAGSVPAGGVAWGAHAGGFLAGLLLVFPFKRR